jgi:two-component system LytT family sensor kinase
MLSYTKPSFHKSKFLTNLKMYKIHVLVWIIFILNETITAYMVAKEFGYIYNYLAHYALNILLFYFNACVILPLGFKDKRKIFWRLPLLVLSEIFAYLLLGYAADYTLVLLTNPAEKAKLSFDEVFVTGGIWRSIYFLGFSTGYYYITRYLKASLANKILEKKALEHILRDKETELELVNIRNAYLQAQINPHFLNSALNFIYGSARKSEPAISDCIFLLSKITRYATSPDHSGSRGLLREEISQVQDLIKLWKILKNNMIYIDFHYDQASTTVEFIPLILLTLTENIFKHGNLRIPEQPARITLRLHGTLLSIETDNLIAQKQKEERISHGLKNVSERLTYAYGEAATVRFYRTEQAHFRVLITVDLAEAPGAVVTFPLENR